MSGRGDVRTSPLRVQVVLRSCVDAALQKGAQLRAHYEENISKCFMGLEEAMGLKITLGVTCGEQKVQQVIHGDSHRCGHPLRPSRAAEGRHLLPSARSHQVETLIYGIAKSLVVLS